MVSHEQESGVRGETGMSRRRFLAATGTATGVGLAGCSQVTQQSFEARPVVLPESARQELVLAETTRDSKTVTRQGPGDVGEITLTNQAAVYRRGPARGTPSLVEKFLSTVNGTPGSGAAVNPLASDLGVEEVPMPIGEEDGSLPASKVGVKVPAGVRAADEIKPLNLLVHGSVEELAEAVTYAGDDPGALFPVESRQGTSFFPGLVYSPDDLTRAALEEWMPDTRLPENSTEVSRVLVPNARQFLSRIGMDGLTEGARSLEPGETFETADTMFVSTLADFENPHDVVPRDLLDPPSPDLFDTGSSAPLPGPYGLGALASPDASVGGESVNPIGRMDFMDILCSEQGKELLGQVGLTDTVGVHPWSHEPVEVTGEFDPLEPTVLDAETELRTFLGVVEGEDGHWGVGIHMARVEADDVVITGSVTRRPVGTPEGGMEVVRGPSYDTIRRAREFAEETLGRLERA